MKQTLTIEVVDTAALRFLRDMAAISLIRFVPETVPDDDLVTARLNAVYEREDSSLDPAFARAQAEAIAGEDW